MDQPTGHRAPSDVPRFFTPTGVVLPGVVLPGVVLPGVARGISWLEEVPHFVIDYVQITQIIVSSQSSNFTESYSEKNYLLW